MIEKIIGLVVIGAFLRIVSVRLFGNDNIDPLAGIFWGALTGLLVALIVFTP